VIMPQHTRSFRLWLEHPEQTLMRKVFFQIHLWSGAVMGFYVLLMSLTGSLLVFRNHLPAAPAVLWVARFHTSLLAGYRGRLINGAAAALLILISITGLIVWWPGMKNWRRGVSVNWRARFARLNWDLHSALGFWASSLVLLWAISGFYFAYPDLFNRVAGSLDPRDRYADQYLAVLASLHFGRFNGATEIIWAIGGLIPAVLVVTGTFLCCRRAWDWLSLKQPVRKLTRLKGDSTWQMLFDRHKQGTASRQDDTTMTFHTQD